MFLLKDTENEMIRIFMKMKKLGPGIVTLISILASEIIYFFIALFVGAEGQPIGYIAAFLIPLVIAYPTVSIFLSVTKIIQKQHKEIEMKNNLKNTMLSVVSHDVKGPLINISSLLDFYFQKEISKEELDQLLIELQQQVNTNLDFVMNILQWTKTQFDGFQVIKTTIDLNELITKMLGAYKFQVQQKKITVETNMNLTVNADRDLLRLVLRNLLSNAIKFSETGGKITISAKIEKGSLIAKVTDNGIGMDKEKLHSLFDENMLKSSKGTCLETGTGLGLKLCKTFIDALGGNIWAESEPGKGSVFYFTIPQ